MSIRNRLFPTFIRLHRYWLRYLTPGGKTLAAAMLFCLPGIVSDQIPLLQLFCASLVLFMAVGLVGLYFSPRLATTLQARATSVCGEAVELRIRLSSRARSCFDLALLPEAAGPWQFESASLPVTSLGPGESCIATVRLRPTRRGVFSWPSLRIASTFPLNLLRFHQTLVFDGELVVTPAYRPLASLSRESSSHALCGAHVDGLRTGASWEYLSSREYEPGIPVRRWDYGSWARLARPVVREFREPEQSTACLIVDTFLASPSGSAEPHPQLEAVMSLAAALVHELTFRHWQIMLLATGPQLVWHADQTPERREAALMEQLAVATAASPHQIDGLRSQLERLDLRSCAVFALLADWDPERERLFQALAGGGVIRAVLVAGKTAEFSGPHQAAVVTPSQIEAGKVHIR